ncbi:hypothetical protein IEO21_08541 [Rhodonia placenta]|uniref:Sister chromatid cohesion protein n=1 Tax=Rhodonia placenta TaxID=104341 RepID=A0A8H7NW89_9APHY|nr:hypothetical protein IEO21_08541 [Postia placenta]
MNKNDWYRQQPNGYHQEYSSPQVPAGRVTADSVQDAHALLAVYPFASATPATHVARHLSNLSISAAPPSYIQQHAYGGQASSSHSPHFPVSSEYAAELNHMASPSIPAYDGGYWEATRNDAVKYLGEQGFAYSYYNSSSPWDQSFSHPSSYQSIPFAHSVFQHSAPSTAYPTPPPPGISTSSSSLAHALEEPIPKRAKTIYKPEESKQFFNDFIAKSSADAASQSLLKRSHPTTPHRPRQVLREEESPDPLAIGFSSPHTPTSMQTPRKRKTIPCVELPSLKRLQLDQVSKTSSKSSAKSSTKLARTPTVSTGNVLGTPTAKRLLPYVEVPCLPQEYLTPTSRKRTRSPSRTPVLNGKGKGKARDMDYDGDLGGFGSSDDDGPRNGHRPIPNGSVHSSSKRATGERDDRAPIEKFTTLLEDIFEAEDSLPPDADVRDLPSEFFSPHTVESAYPLLHPNLIRKLSTHIGKVARPSKRMRLSSREGNAHSETPRRKGRMAEVDAAVLSRTLKILERSVKAGEDLEPFGAAAPIVPKKPPSSPRKKSTKKGQTGEDRRSKTPKSLNDEPGSGDEGLSVGVDDDSASQAVTETDLEKLSNTLDVARDSLLAADCCIGLLSSDRLTKQLYSEELITTCLSSAKNQLAKIVYPFVEASTDSNHQPPLLRHVVQPSSRDGSHRRQLAEIFQAISSVVPRINDLVSAETMAMSESIIIQAVYIAIGPFFVTEGSESEGKGKKDLAVLHTLGNSAMRGLRLDALALMRSIFAKHEEQRSWIIEEILSSLIKLSDTKQKAGQFRLRDGRSIRTVSALLLQLVQTSAHDVRVEARALQSAREQVLAMRRQESSGDLRQGPFLDEKDMEEIRLYTSGLDSATKAAKTIIAFLTQRSGKSKVTKNSNEAEYRTIFDNLISDLLAVLFWPEWPAASLLLSIICKFMVSSLDDVKTTNQNDNNAIKTIALDHLGVIAAHLRSTLLKFRDEKALKPLDEVLLFSLRLALNTNSRSQTLSSVNTKQLQRLACAHQDLGSHLTKRASEDQAYDSARELTAVLWGQELAFTLQQCSAMITETGEDLDPLVDRSKILAFGYKVKEALRRIWDASTNDVFDVGGTHDEVAHTHRLSEEIGTIQTFKNSFTPILNVVLQALDAPPVFMRTKALKALGQIVTSDPSILSTPNVRRAIESHLLDSSSAVRDAAVELIGKYMIDSPEFAADYFSKITDRIADTGLGVRKRVIKLLKSYYLVSDDRGRRIEICTRIVLRMLDEDDTVKDLAIKTMEELWFQGPGFTQRGKSLAVADDKSQLLSKVSVIMGVSSHFKDRHSPLEDLLHQMMVDKGGAEMTSLHTRYSEICEALIDGLVDASDLPGFTVANCVRTIHLFASAYPAVLSGANASTLLPYLKNAATPEEQSTSDYLLRIFRASIPHMPKTAAKFGQELQLALQPMIIKPSASAGLLGLQETVACMCAIVLHITHDFGRLVALLKSCNARLQQAIRRPPSQVMTTSEQRALSILLFIVSLLCEHCPFDQIRAENEQLRHEIESVTKGSVIEHVYQSLLELYDKYRDVGLRGRILQCMGFLFRAQPALMTVDASASIMDAIFASPDEDARGRLLRIVQDFLVSEASKHAEKEKANSRSKSSSGKEVNMEELVGNTDGFADSGVSSAVVQRYLVPILEAALSHNAQIQTAAVDILSFTIKQGLAHPLQSFPVIVALETSPNTSFSARASALHTILHSKHTSLLNARYVVSARASFDYQKKLAPGQVYGYRMTSGPTALLHRWYSLVREKRATRQDFLKALVKVFDIELQAKSSQDDVEFVRYMTENFAAFEYKTQEEVLTVLKYLTGVLSTTGMQLVENLSPSHLLSQLHAPMQPRLPLMRTSIIVAMIMLLKAYLKMLYGISEDKCAKWVVGKKNAIGDRPAARRHERPLLWERLSFATAPLLTNEDCDVQRTKFLEIWNEDGLTAEPEDDFA